MLDHPIKRRYHLKFGGVVYVLISCFIGVAALQSQTNLLFWIFGLMLGGLLVSGVLSGAMLMGLRVLRLTPEDGAVDEALVMRYELVNRNRRVPCFGLLIREAGATGQMLRGVPEGWVLHVAPASAVQAETVGYPTRRGVVELHDVQVTTTFPFGILRKSISSTQPARVIVYPRLHRLRRELMAVVHAHDASGSRAGDMGGGDEEYFGLRDYRAGDPLRLIHWKRTAKTNRLVTREMTRQRPDRVMILLDLRQRGPKSADRAERAISFAASMFCEAMLMGFEAGVAVVGARLEPMEPKHGRWHRKRVLEALAELDVAAEAPAGRVPPVREANWVVIHGGAVDAAVGPERALRLSDEDLEKWTQAAPAAAITPAPAPAPRGARA